MGRALTTLTWADIRTRCREVCGALVVTTPVPNGVYGIPAGGVPVALLMAERLNVPVLDAPSPGCLVVDDIADSGSTLTSYVVQGYRCVALFRKPHTMPFPCDALAERISGWVQFPWEHEGAPTDAVVRLLQYVGEDPTREGVRDTPRRVVKALAEMTEGYKQDPAAILSTTFAETYDAMVVLKDIPFVSLCEHHMLPFAGVAQVGYVPHKRVVGVSKLARLVHCYAKRLQVQERLTREIAAALDTHLHAVGVGVIIAAHHECMSCRGVKVSGTAMVTSSLTGVLRDEPSARAEFLALCGGR